MVIGFLLAAYSVTANDSLQTLGSYLSSNEHRTPKWVQMVFLCTLTASVLSVGWFINNGEPALGLGLTLVERLFEPNHRAGSEFNRLWYGLQWCSTGSLWSLWLVQDLANIFIFLPRRQRFITQ